MQLLVDVNGLLCYPPFDQFNGFVWLLSMYQQNTMCIRSNVIV